MNGRCGLRACLIKALEATAAFPGSHGSRTNKNNGDANGFGIIFANGMIGSRTCQFMAMVTMTEGNGQGGLMTCNSDGHDPNLAWSGEGRNGNGDAGQFQWLSVTPPPLLGASVLSSPMWLALQCDVFEATIRSEAPARCWMCWCC